jgi:iron only hydrogenase large subunit-like protein
MLYCSYQRTMNMPYTANLNDDLACFLRDLKAGLPVRMLIAPAAPPVFEDFLRVLGYLRSLGVEAFYPVLPYADITVWAYYRILKANPSIKLITSACVGMNRYFKEHHEEHAASLSSVFSPLLCTARYLKTYRRLEEPLAFLSPCLLKKNEFVTKNREELVRYNITINALNTWLAAEGIDIRQYEPWSEERERNGEGLTLAVFGGIGKALEALLPGVKCHVEQGLGNAVSFLSGNRDFWDSPDHALVFEPYACKGGCVHGSGIRNHKTRGERNFLTSGEQKDLAAVFELFSYYDKTLRLEDFRD